MTNQQLEEELRKMANQYWSLQQEVKVFLDAAEVIHDYDRVKQSESIYREEFTKAVEACAWMHDDKTLGITIGARITVDGVMALKRQRDELRESLAATHKVFKEDNESHVKRAYRAEAENARLREILADMVAVAESQEWQNAELSNAVNILSNKEVSGEVRSTGSST